MSHAQAPDGETCVSAYDGDTMKRFLADYDYSERFDENKHYTHAEFVESYDGKPPRRYKWLLVKNRISPISANLYERWVVAEEKLSDAELAELAAFCRCKRCTLPWYSRWSWGIFVCRCCIGCLGAGHDYARPSEVRRAREARDRAQ